MIRIATTIMLCILFIGCTTAEENSADPNALDLCNKVHEIRTMSFKGEHVEDEVYNEMLEAGDSVLPCLVKKMTDTTLMPTPRPAVAYGGTTAGDVAFFVFLDITGEDIESFLPEMYREKYDTQGVYAYYRYVETEDNRKMLQENVRQWLKDRH